MSASPFDDFVLLILNCEKFRNKAQQQKQTWLCDAGFKYFHIIGKEDLDSDYKFDYEEKILWVKAPDDYISLPKKTMSALYAFRKTFPQCKYVFKTDDNQMLKISKKADSFFQMIRSIIASKTPKVHYAGYIVDVKTPYLSKYHLVHPELPENLPIYATKYCSGPFYILSMEAICCLLLKRKQIEAEYFEDYAVGLHLGGPFKETILNIDSSSFFSEDNT